MRMVYIASIKVKHRKSQCKVLAEIVHQLLLRTGSDFQMTETYWFPDNDLATNFICSVKECDVITETIML